LEVRATGHFREMRVSSDEPPSSHRKPKLLELVRRAARARQYSQRTEEADVGWIRRFVRFHGTRHPKEMGVAQVTAFLSHLANERAVSASTQRYDIRTVQELLGHKSVRTTMIYTHVLNRGGRGMRSPLDLL
jgi:site-specific recombinase XerD